MSTISLRKGETPNETTVTIAGLRIDFSYETPVAFHGDYDSAVRVNDWSVTTGKHLNRIDGGGTHAKAARIPGDEFNQRLQVAINTALDAAVNS